MEVELSLVDDVQAKIGIFVLVQVPVYLILSNSSDIFSKNKMMRSLSFKPPHSVSIRRILAVKSDKPPGGEASPLSSGFKISKPRISYH